MWNLIASATSSRSGVWVFTVYNALTTPSFRIECSVYQHELSSDICQHPFSNPQTDTIMLFAFSIYNESTSVSGLASGFECYQQTLDYLRSMTNTVCRTPNISEWPRESSCRQTKTIRCVFILYPTIVSVIVRIKLTQLFNKRSLYGIVCMSLGQIDGSVK